MKLQLKAVNKEADSITTHFGLETESAQKIIEKMAKVFTLKAVSGETSDITELLDIFLEEEADFLEEMGLNYEEDANSMFLLGMLYARGITHFNEVTDKIARATSKAEDDSDKAMNRSKSVYIPSFED